MGGIPNYSYLWSTFDTTKVIDSVSKGWYYVSITDSENCFVSDSIFIDHPDTLQFDIISKKPETCMGVSYDGEIHLEIIGRYSSIQSHLEFLFRIFWKFRWWVWRYYF